MPTETTRAIRREVDALAARAAEVIDLEMVRIGRRRTKDPAVREAARRLDLAGAYQGWYATASTALRRLAPERLEEFAGLYRVEAREGIDADSYGIADYLLGIFADRKPGGAVDGAALFAAKWASQAAILAGAVDRLDSVLGGMERALQAELLDHELAAAEDLLRKGHLRAAGALAGVLLERHLTRLAVDRRLTLGRRGASLATLNDALKEAEIYDDPTWRRIGSLGALREACFSGKGLGPEREEVQDLVGGVGLILAEVR